MWSAALAAVLVVAAAEEPERSTLDDLWLTTQLLLSPTPRASDCAEQWNCLAAGDIELTARAALRAGYELQQPSERAAFVGQNDGFRFDQARFGVTLDYGAHWRLQLVADAARLLPGAEPNAPVRHMTLALADAYLEWRPFAGDLALRLGQQRMPADVEGMSGRGRLVFATRSVAGGGVEPGRGFQVDGLSAGREIGFVVGDVFWLPASFYLAYAAGVGNGNGSNTTLNDNVWPAGYLRLHAGYDDKARLALGGRYNPRTVGQVPIQQDETEAVGFLEGSVSYFGFDLLAIGQLQYVSFDSVLPDEGDPNRARVGFGATSWLVVAEPFGLPTYGVRAGYRVSYLEQAVALPDEGLLEHSFAVRYDPEYLPHTAFVVDFTSLWTLDQAGLMTPDNNRVFALVHVEL